MHSSGRVYYSNGHNQQLVEKTKSNETRKNKWTKKRKEGRKKERKEGETEGRREAGKIPLCLTTVYYWSTVVCLVTKSCPTLCNPMDHSLSDSSVHGMSQSRILKWVAISFSRNLPGPGIKPKAVAMAYRSFTTKPPGIIGVWAPEILYQQWAKHAGMLVRASGKVLMFLHAVWSRERPWAFDLNSHPRCTFCPSIIHLIVFDSILHL